jgi:hypothetical protein
MPTAFSRGASWQHSQATADLVDVVNHVATTLSHSLS